MSHIHDDDDDGYELKPHPFVCYAVSIHMVHTSLRLEYSFNGMMTSWRYLARTRNDPKLPLVVRLIGVRLCHSSMVSPGCMSFKWTNMLTAEKRDKQNGHFMLQ